MKTAVESLKKSKEDIAAATITSPAAGAAGAGEGDNAGPVTAGAAAAVARLVTEQRIAAAPASEQDMARQEAEEFVAEKRAIELSQQPLGGMREWNATRESGEGKCSICKKVSVFFFFSFYGVGLSTICGSVDRPLGVISVRRCVV